MDTTESGNRAKEGRLESAWRRRRTQPPALEATCRGPKIVHAPPAAPDFALTERRGSVSESPDKYASGAAGASNITDPTTAAHSHSPIHPPSLPPSFQVLIALFHQRPHHNPTSNSTHPDFSSVCPPACARGG